MNLNFETNFVVMPRHTNYMYPMIFGGAFFAELDLCAAQTVARLLYSSETCKASVTHHFEGKFHKPCYAGDMIFLTGEVVELGKKSIVVEVKAYREKRGTGQRDFVAEAKFVFISVKEVINPQDKPHLLPYAEHGLKLPNHKGIERV